MWHLTISGGQESDQEAWQNKAYVSLPPTHVHTVSPCGKCSKKIQTPLWLQLHIWLWVFWSDERGLAPDSGLCSAQSGLTSDRKWNVIQCSGYWRPEGSINVWQQHYPGHNWQWGRAMGLKLPSEGDQGLCVWGGHQRSRLPDEPTPWKKQLQVQWAHSPCGLGSNSAAGSRCSFLYQFRSEFQWLLLPGIPQPRGLDGISMWNSLKHNKSSRRETIFHNIDEDPLEETFQVFF